MTKHHKDQQNRSRREQARRRKEWLASSTVVLFIVALAGCQNSQRLSPPDNQYFTLSTWSPGASTESSPTAAAAVPGQAPAWTSTSYAAAADGTTSAQPGILAFVAKTRPEFGARADGAEASAAAIADQADNSGAGQAEGPGNLAR